VYSNGMQKRNRQAPISKARAELLAYIASANVRDTAALEHNYVVANHEKELTSAQIDAGRLYGAGNLTPRAGLYLTVKMPTGDQRRQVRP
jgi:hypothetical protein